MRAQFPIELAVSFSLPLRPDRIWKRPNLLSDRLLGLFHRKIKRPGSEVYRSRPFHAKVKNVRSYASIEPTSLWSGAYVIKHGDNFTADDSGRGVWVMNRIRSLGRWDRGSESHSRHGCLCAFILFVLSCVGSDLATGCSPIQGVLPILYRIKKLKKRPSSKRAVEP
jgi:hypothetical protein